MAAMEVGELEAQGTRIVDESKYFKGGRTLFFKIVQTEL
jgi:hypothetical protein